MNAARTCFEAWLGERGTEGDLAIKAGLDRIRQYFIQFGDADFNHGFGEQLGSAGLPSGRKQNGWITKDGDWLVTVEVFRNDIAKGHNADALIDVLFERGLIEQPYED